MNHLQLREELIRLARAIGTNGLGVGKAGNLSARAGEGFLVTPTGMHYERLVPEDIVMLDSSGASVAAKRKPSSEWRFHRDIYARRQEVAAIVHVHSPYATALACVRRPLPAFHYMVAAAGGNNVRCAEYATFGTQALSDNVLAALEDRRACLLANHGLITVGTGPGAAFELAILVEDLCRQYLLACSFGEPVILDEAEMRLNLEKFRSYGKQ